jgi:hypothetical protein
MGLLCQQSARMELTALTDQLHPLHAAQVSTVQLKAPSNYHALQVSIAPEEASTCSSAPMELIAHLNPQPQSSAPQGHSELVSLRTTM